MKPKSLEIFIPGPAGRLEAKYYKNPKFGSPVAIVLHPHPQYGGTMNNKIVQQMYNIFLENGFSVIKINFRGVGRSEGIFDNFTKKPIDQKQFLQKSLQFTGISRKLSSVKL